MTDNFDRRLEALLATLKNASTVNWGSGHSPAMTTTIERIIQIHLDKSSPAGVVNADQFRRNVIKNRFDQKYSRKLTAADNPKQVAAQLLRQLYNAT